MTPQEIAQKLYEFYNGHPERWVKNVFAANAQGEPVHPRDPKARVWSLMGAAHHLVREDGAQVMLPEFEQAMKDRLAFYGRVAEIVQDDHVEWEDSPTTQFQDVLNTLKRIAYGTA